MGLIVNKILQKVSKEQTEGTVQNVLYKTYLGTPVYSDLDISPISYNKLLGGDQPITLNCPRIQIAKCLFTVTQDKKIVMTSVQGRAGTVKEYIGDGDFEISIEGMIFGGSKIQGGSHVLYPYSEVSNLLAVLQCPLPLKVNSWFLSQFGITDIVIKKYDFAQAEGEISQQKFSIEALSDIAVILKQTGV